MKLVLDTNIVISGLMFPTSPPGRVLDYWFDGDFAVVTCFEHIDELKQATRYPKVRERVRPHVVGRTINRLRATGIYCRKIPLVDLSSDPDDNYLLALAQAGEADFLVTGDKAGLLELGQFGPTRIVTARAFLDGL